MNKINQITARITMTTPDPSLLLKQFRLDLCHKIIKFKIKRKLTCSQLGQLIGTDKGKISKILRSQIDEFSTDRLINYLLKIKPKTKLKIS